MEVNGVDGEQWTKLYKEQTSLEALVTQEEKPSLEGDFINHTFWYSIPFCFPK